MVRTPYQLSAVVASPFLKLRAVRLVWAGTRTSTGLWYRSVAFEICSIAVREGHALTCFHYGSNYTQSTDSVHLDLIVVRNPLVH